MNWKTGVPGRPPAGGAAVPRCGSSSSTMTTESPIWISAWAIVRAGGPHSLGRAEHLGVEVQGPRGALHDQARGHPAVGVRNRAGLVCRCHLDLLHGDSSLY